MAEEQVTDPGEPTEEQASEALQQLAASATESEEEPVQAAEEQPAQADTEAQETAEEGVETTVEEPGADDVASLKARLEAFEQQEKERQEQYDARMRAINERYQTNQQILQDRYLRKSTVADKALRALKASRSENGVAETEVDQIIREMEGTMHPESTQYAPPQETYAPPPEDNRVLVVNAFLNEKGMTTDDATQFDQWIRTEAPNAMSQAEQAVARESLDGFLRLAHARWQQTTSEESKQAKRDDALSAVKTVQRTQQAAARAASATTGSPRRQPVAQPTEVDVSKFTDNDVSALLRKTVEHYTG